MSLHLASKTLIVSSSSNSRHYRPLDIGPLIAGVNILPENAIASQNLAHVELERCKPLLPAMWECLDHMLVDNGSPAVSILNSNLELRPVYERSEQGRELSMSLAQRYKRGKRYRYAAFLSSHRLKAGGYPERVFDKE
jgi:hypothetical protein